MRQTTIWIFMLMLHAATAFAQTSRFVIDDDEFLDKVTDASGKLLRKGRLKAQESLRHEVRTKGFSARLATPSHQKLSPPDLCERLRESTLAVGTYYKCPDCGDWHFNASAGFVMAEGGVVCTCCHVISGEDEGVTDSYIVAADSGGHVYPVESVLAADTASDTCLLKLALPEGANDGRVNLKPLPLRSDARAGERVYCLSHPGGFHFMFTEGLVARLNRKRNDVFDDHGHTNGLVTRPILFLNVTTEFAPGSSGAPIVDESGNVVAQVASIADAGEPDSTEQNAPASPSVPVRFCTAAEELLRLVNPGLKEPLPAHPKPKPEPEKRRKQNSAAGTSVHHRHIPSPG